MQKEKIRTIITQDAEVDDQNSLRHFLLYTNEVELQGIVQTSSVFHWIGVPGTETPKPESEFNEFGFPNSTASYAHPFRWPGVSWMFEEIADYAKVYPCLKAQDPDYPEPEYLRSITKIGNIGYPGEMLAPSEGSELIRRRILDDDPRTLYLQVWGGCNTIARALLDIETEYAETEDWEELHRRLSEKVVLTACGEQDDTYKNYISLAWPDIQFVHCMQMGSYAYPWSQMPEGPSKESLGAAFMKQNLLNGKGPLLNGYATWCDGKHYDGETDDNQFGSNLTLQENWWGQIVGIGPYEPYSFLSEGDSPTYFMLFDWGLRTLDDFSYGGFSGRYLKDETKVNANGEPLNYWIAQQDSYLDAAGNAALTEAMWPYVVDIQNDFAARADWCVTDPGTQAEHAPKLSISEGTDLTAAAGETVALTCRVCGNQMSPIALSARIYEEPSTVTGAKVRKDTDTAHSFTVEIPTEAESGQKLHVILQAKNQWGHQLVHYQQVIITVR